MKNILIYIFIFSLISCNQRKAANEIIEIKFDQNPSYINENDFFDNNYSDSISLFIENDDCGEWRGAQEKIEIYTNTIREKIFNYKKYKFNCDSIYFYYNSKPILDFERNIILNENEKIKISSFFQKLIKAKIQEKYGSNAGKIFHLQNNDSTLVISILTDKTDIIDSFNNLKKELKLNK